VRHLAELLAGVFIIEYLVVPQIGGTHDAIHTLATASPVLPVAGLVLEALALLAYFQLTRMLIPSHSDPGLLTVSRIQMSTLALSHCVVGGNTVGYLLGYRLFTKAGVTRSDTGVALGTQALGSAVVLNVIFWLAVVVSLPLYGFHPAYLVAAIAGLLLMGAVTALFLLFTRGDKRATRALRAIGTKVPFLHPDTLPRLFSQLVERLHQITADKRHLGGALAFAAANWLLDAASLFVFLGTFGYWINPVALLVAYGVANILGVIPITPGGLGVIEFGLISVLVAFGVPSEVAGIGVVAWRLVNFWLPIPLGGAAYVSLRVHPPAEDQAGLAERRALWKARWAWFVDLFNRETPRGDVDEGLSAMESGVEDDDAGEVASGAPAGTAESAGVGPQPSDASPLSSNGGPPARLPGYRGPAAGAAGQGGAGPL
jgi:hypothetical protein